MIPRVHRARGWASIGLPLAQHRSTSGHAIAAIAARAIPKDACELPGVRGRLGCLRQAFSEVATLSNQHTIEHYAVVDHPVNRTRLATRWPPRISERYTQDCRSGSDICDHAQAYSLPVGAFRPIQGQRWCHRST